MNRVALIVVVSWACGLTVGCGSAPRSGETLMESLLTYHEGLRWQRFAAAAGRLPPAERSAFIDEWDARSRELHITDYDILDVVPRGDSATVQVKMSWYGESEGTLRETYARQRWQRRGKIWMLLDEVRSRGAAMPGLSEPAEAGAEPLAEAGAEPLAEAGAGR